jgi:hypothetical protein
MRTKKCSQPIAKHSTGIRFECRENGSDSEERVVLI